ncbi:hypothetical protein IH979_02905, partial [Patescibacteria group bacterium]|nr:hypothetical protein [Patescibacteria group bacterium]
MKWLLALCLLLAPATALAKKDKKSDAVKTEDVETVEEEGDQKRKRKKWICGHMPGVVITPGGVGLMGVPHVMIARGCDEYYGRRRPPPPNSQPPPPRTSQRIVYNTNSLTMQAIDRYRDVEPYPRGDELDPSVCWAGVPPEGWEAVGPVRQLEIKNTTDQFVSLTVEKR